MRKQQLDMVSGWRRRRNDTAFKCAASKLYNGMLNALFFMKLHDHNSGIKVMKRAVLGTIPLNRDWHRFITVIARYSGYTVGEIEVGHSARAYGKSRYGIGRCFRFAIDLPLVAAYLFITHKK